MVMYNTPWQEVGPNGNYLQNGGRIPEAKPTTPGAMLTNVLVWLYRINQNQIEVLFQQRSQYVNHYSLKYDASAGGHIDYGETPLQAAIREAREEIGAELSPDKIKYIFGYASSTSIFHNFIYDYTGKEDNFSFSDSEVVEVKWVPLSELDYFVQTFVKDPLRDHPFCFLALKEWLVRNHSSDGNN